MNNSGKGSEHKILLNFKYFRYVSDKNGLCKWKFNSKDGALVFID